MAETKILKKYRYTLLVISGSGDNRYVFDASSQDCNSVAGYYYFCDENREKISAFPIGITVIESIQEIEPSVSSNDDSRDYVTSKVQSLNS